LHNGQPLPEKEQKAEDKKLQDVAKERRREKDKKSLFHPNLHLELPLDQLEASFDVALKGTEELEGRKRLVFTAAPKAGTDLKQAAHDGTAYEMKFWVDEQDHVFRRFEAKVLADGMRYEKDSLISYDFAKVNNEAWLPVRFWFKGRVRYMLQDVADETEQSYSNYKKFHADTKVVVE
jgi:hypothetical protein